MTIKEIIKKKNMSVYKLSKKSGVPYTTVNEICNEKVQIEKCSVETIYRIAKALEVSMEEILDQYFIKRSDFENFKSTICHRVKEMGDVDFIIKTLEDKEIRVFYERKWYPESLYLLAMLDYLSKENNIPICNEYDDIRNCKLETPLYPTSVLAMSAAAKNDKAKKQALKSAIPEFLRFNIVENEVRNVI